MFAAAPASASAATHTANESLANLGESLYAIIDFKQQPLKKNTTKQQFILLFRCGHNLPAAVFIGLHMSAALITPRPPLLTWCKRITWNDLWIDIEHVFALAV